MSERSRRIEKFAGTSLCGIDLGTNASHIASRKRVERFGISALQAVIAEITRVDAAQQA